MSASTERPLLIGLAALSLVLSTGAGCAKKEDAAPAASSVARTQSQDTPATAASEPQPFPGSATPEAEEAEAAEAAARGLEDARREGAGAPPTDVIVGGKRIGLDGSLDRKADRFDAKEADATSRPAEAKQEVSLEAQTKRKKSASSAGRSAGGLLDDLGSATAKPSKKAPAPVPSEDADAVEELPKGGVTAAMAEADRLMIQLSSLEQQLRRAGVRLPQDAATGAAAGDVPAQVSCTDVCEVAEAICDLEIRICALSRAHPEDDRYARACERASGDCRVGSEACNGCD